MAFTAITALLITLTLVISYYTYRICFYSPRGKHNTPHEQPEGEQYLAVEENMHRAISIMEKYPFEQVTIESYDGIRLSGRYYHLRDGAPLLILFHGYRSHAYRDASGGHILSRKLGFNALVIDQRAHGDSEGRTITFGIRERRDCLSWVEYANHRFGEETPIVLSGLSMGAATVLMAMELDLPQNVAAVIADSPYAAPSSIILKVAQDMHYPPKLCYPFIYLGALLYGHFRLDACCAREAVSKSTIPVLLIHGEDDRLVPCSMSHEIAKAARGHAEVHTFPGAGHGLCYMIDPIRYEQAVLHFLDRIPEVSQGISPDFKITKHY